MPPRGEADIPDIPRDLLDQLFQAAVGRLAAIRSEVDREVVEWRWHSSQAYDPTPLKVECRGDVPGRRLAKPPKQMNNHAAYGIDAGGRVVVERDGTSGRYVGEYRERFFRYRDDALEQYVFGPPPDEELWAVAVYSPPERPTQSASKSKDGYGANRYEWGPVGVKKISAWSTGWSSEGQMELNDEFFVTYHDDGRLRQIDRLQHEPISNGRIQVYPPPKRRRKRRYSTELRFDWEQVSSLVRGAGLERGLLWVKDAGSYLMAEGDPSSAVWAENATQQTDPRDLIALCGAADFAHHISAEDLQALGVSREGIGGLVIAVDLVDGGVDADAGPTVEGFTLRRA